jgi:hypothetical protein
MKSPSEKSRSTRGRLGGLTTASRHDPMDYTAAARARSNGLNRWLEKVPADLPEEERLRRAEAMRRKHYVELGIKSGKARREKAKKTK